MGNNFPENNEYEVLKNCLSTFLRVHFLSRLKTFSKGCGFGSDQGGVIFPSSFEEWEKDDEDYINEGVRIFDFTGSAITVSDDIFYKYLVIASNQYLEEHPDEEFQVHEYLKKIRYNLNV